MRVKREIQRAHDILISVILGDVTIDEGTEDDLSRLRAAADTLCWVLSHGHNTQFADNLAAIEAEIPAAGFALIDLGQARPRYERYDRKEE
mgnify:CR=1 FL=1